MLCAAASTLCEPTREPLCYGDMQVYKALRGGVQEVAVKVLLCTDEDQLTAFRKVRPQ